ncbi:hypothetical protein K1T71_012948 [Dendrolimus kikuchii]|uniref:Uncharacterized protein n=1 Tax=Dendrolimus kikuchii TaxID=765133 RepID=A0ACC1CII7_9NEOP|nr:hypothetical protein K1T71_012948 [Dendrolimus kikuchii]
MSMTNDETFRFIELYQAENCLWNTRNTNHKNKNIINDSWKRIADTMGVPVHELKKKKEKEDAFKSIWQFYDAMEVFLKDIYECKSICNSEENTQDQEQDLEIDQHDGGEGCSTTGEQISALQASSENSHPVINSKVVQKRRAKHPPELQEANKQMSAAFNTLNNILQNKKNREDKEDDDTDLFCKLLAKQLKDFPKNDKEEIMYEIHG